MRFVTEYSRSILTTGSVRGYALCRALAVHCTFPPASIISLGEPQWLQKGLLCPSHTREVTCQ